MERKRGFEVVNDANRKNKETVRVPGLSKEVIVKADIVLPTRSDIGSAGYDFYMPVDTTVLPTRKLIVWTDVKAYMLEDEVLMLYPRSSMGIKHGLMLSNTVGVIDSSYYSNEGNDGNIGIPLLNTSGKAIEIKAGERFAQGVFTKFLSVDEDSVDKGSERKGGFGSSGK